MVEKKEEKKKVKIKATTGAWWKSTTEEVKTEAQSEETVQPVQKKKPTRKPPAKKKPQSRVARGVKTQKVEKTDSTVPAKGRKTTPAKRKPRPKKATNVESPVEPKSDTAVIEEVVEGTQQEVKSEKPKPAKKPARRGRRKSPKQEIAKDAEQASDVAVSEVVEAIGEVTGEAAEKPVVQEKVETNRKESLEEGAKDKEKLVEGSETAEEVKTPVEASKVSKLLINAEEPEECRLALLEDGKLQSIHVSTTAKTQTKNNIYKARIVAIEPSLQAAFVDYGTEKNGFLPFGEIHPEYYKQNLSNEIQELVDNHQWKRLNISDVLEKGQDVLAQVVKEEIGKKGANMTTYLSLPGRCVVLMPGSDSSGISRKISGENRRSQLRETMKSIDLPEGVGWIVRTASVDITQQALSRDVDYLLKLWEEIRKRGQELEAVGLVYEDHESVLRFLREHFDPSFEEILVDDKDALEQVKKFVAMLPKVQQEVKVRLHQGARPIFNQYSVEDQIESIYQPQVNLPSGGSIVIDPTEALVAIDVNSGSTSKGKNFEASIFQANMEAATELARQLRLRDLGGLIVVDFIDMRLKKNIIAVEKQVKAAMKRDKAKVDFTRISKFGLMQISRQKLGAPIETANYQRCEHCKGRGSVRSIETLSLFYLRRIQTGASRKPVERVECHFPLDVASYLLNNKRSELNDMEKRYQVEIAIFAETNMKPAENNLIFHKAEKDSNSKKQA